MRRVRFALAAGLTLTAAALVIVFSRAPLTVAGTNGVPAKFAVTYIHGGEVNCQGGGTVPKGTEAIRVSLSANTGPSVTLEVLSGSTLVSTGRHGPGWGIDETVTVPVERIPRTIHDARICATLGPAVESIQVNGARVQTGDVRSVWLRMEYLRPGPSSWLSLLPSVARHMGIGRAPSGAWVAYLIIATMIAVAAISSRLLLRELR